MARPGEFDQPVGDPVLPIYEGETCVLIGTGPSININQLAFVHDAQRRGLCRVITINNAYQIYPMTDAHIACNDEWWSYYWNKAGLHSTMLQELNAPRYTWYKDIADEYGITYIKAIVKDGLSTDPRVIHINHGSGPMGINLAVHYGFKRLLLIGHDMKFAPDYNGRAKKEGSSPRHYFGEYPKELQHWPSVKIGLSKPGVIDGLIEAYDKMVPDLKTIGMDVINCTPGTAMTTFPIADLKDELK
jgi:hypothetical protein